MRCVRMRAAGHRRDALARPNAMALLGLLREVAPAVGRVVAERGRGVTADLPAPPSANALFVWRDGRRRKTGAYRKWLRDAEIMYRCGFGCVTPMPNRTLLRVTVEAAIDHKRDLDNLLKPILDSLKHARVIPDDRWVDVIEARRVPAGHEDAAQGASRAAGATNAPLEAGWCRVGVYVLSQGSTTA